MVKPAKAADDGHPWRRLSSAKSNGKACSASATCRRKRRLSSSPPAARRRMCWSVPESRTDGSASPPPPPPPPPPPSSPLPWTVADSAVSFINRRQKKRSGRPAAVGSRTAAVESQGSEKPSSSQCDLPSPATPSLGGVTPGSSLSVARRGRSRAVAAAAAAAACQQTAVLRCRAPQYRAAKPPSVKRRDTSSDSSVNDSVSGSDSSGVWYRYKPVWYQKLMNEDFLTGRALGAQLRAKSPVALLSARTHSRHTASTSAAANSLRPLNAVGGR